MFPRMWGEENKGPVGRVGINTKERNKMKLASTFCSRLLNIELAELIYDQY